MSRRRKPKEVLDFDFAHKNNRYISTCFSMLRVQFSKPHKVYGSNVHTI